MEAWARARAATAAEGVEWTAEELEAQTAHSLAVAAQLAGKQEEKQRRRGGHSGGSGDAEEGDDGDQTQAARKGVWRRLQATFTSLLSTAPDPA